MRHRVPTLQGGVAEGYGSVADAFRRNFAERGEIGAACAVYRDGRAVADLWGGFRDGRTGARWQQDTLAFWASSTKGMAATAVLLAASRGLFDLDEPVARWWPQFAQHGKEAITVRHLLSHQAGLAALDRQIDYATVADPDALAEVLAAQRPWWEPGTRHGYHSSTFGWCESMVLRRVDPDGRTLGRFFAEEVAAPLGAEFYIGLPDAIPDDRVAARHIRFIHRPTIGWQVLARMANPRSLLMKSSRDLPAPRGETLKQYWRLEIPAASGIGQARAVARIYGALATGGTELGMDPDIMRELAAPATPPPAGFGDVVLGIDMARTLGFIKPTAGSWFGTSAGQAFGHDGAGGSGGFADPDVGIGFAYAPNRMLAWHLRTRDDPRKRALIDALYQALGVARTTHAARS